MVGMVEEAAAAAPKLQRKRIERPEKPDRKALEKSVSTMNEEINELQSRIQQIKTQLESNKQTRNSQSPELVEARNTLAVMNCTFNEQVEEKRKLRAELESADKLREQCKADARALREKLTPYVKADQIENEMKKLEYKLQHTSMSMKDEKAVMQQIKDLKKSRDVVKDYTQKMDQINQDQGLRAEFVEKVREKDQLLTDLKAQISEQKKLIDEIRERDAAKAIDVHALVVERNSAYEKIRSLRESIKTMRSEFRAKENEYYEKEREFQEFLAAKQRREEEKRYQEQLEKEKIRKQRALENFVEKYTDEIILCDQLAPYLQKFAPSAEEEKKTLAPLKSEVPTPQGFGNMLTSKKNRSDEELEGWFGGYGSKAKGNNNKGKAAAVTKGKEKLSLTIDALSSLSKLNVAAPVTVADINKSLQDLKARREEFVKLQAEVKAARENSTKAKDPQEPAQPVEHKDEAEDEGGKQTNMESETTASTTCVDSAVVKMESEKLVEEVISELVEA